MTTARIAVTGAAGHLGRTLIDHLGATPIRAIDLAARPLAVPAGVEWVTADVTDEGAMRDALDGIEVLYHLAAVISLTPKTEALAWKVNVKGARITADVAKEVGVQRFVHCSSVHAFDAGATTRSIDESTPRARGTSPAYDRSKAAGEASVRRRIAQGLDVVVVHPAGIIGPQDPGTSMMGSVLRRLTAGSLPAVVDGSFEWVDVRDVAASIAAAADKGRTGESYLLGGNFASIPDIARMVSEASGVPAPRRCLPLWTAGVAAAVSRIAPIRRMDPHLTSDAVTTLAEAKPVNSAKARSELDHRSRPLPETIRDTVDWIRGSSPVDEAGSDSNESSSAA